MSSVQEPHLHLEVEHILFLDIVGNTAPNILKPLRATSAVSRTPYKGILSKLEQLITEHSSVAILRERLAL